MKIKFIIRFVTVMLMLYFCQEIKAQKNDWQKEKLTGRVKSVKDITYKVMDTFGVVKKGEIKNGYNEDFNSIGNEMEVDFFYKSDSSLNSKNIFKYDEKGKLIEENIYKSNGRLDTKKTFKYDDKGNEIEDDLYKSDGSLDSKYTYKYDEAGNEIECKVYKSDNNLEHKYIYKYDQKGNQIERSGYKSDGSISYKSTSKYDDNGKKTEDVYYYKSDINFTDKTLFKYDDKGNLIESNTFKFDSTLKIKRNFEVIYDVNGNWIKRTYFKGEGKIPDEISEREIVYY